MRPLAPLGIEPKHEYINPLITRHLGVRDSDVGIHHVAMSDGR